MPDHVRGVVLIRPRTHSDDWKIRGVECPLDRTSENLIGVHSWSPAAVSYQRLHRRVKNQGSSTIVLDADVRKAIGRDGKNRRSVGFHFPNEVFPLNHVPWRALSCHGCTPGNIIVRQRHGPTELTQGDIFYHPMINNFGESSVLCPVLKLRTHRVQAHCARQGKIPARASIRSARKRR